MDRKTVRGFFETEVDLIEYALDFNADFIGRAVPFRYKSTPYRICLPNFAIPTTARPYVKVKPIEPVHEGTKVKMAYIMSDGIHKTSKKELDRFGRATRFTRPSWDDDGTQELRDLEVHEFQVKKLIIQSAKAVDAKAARKYKREITEWKVLFPLWLQAIEFRDLSAPTVWSEQADRINAYFIPTERYQDLGHNARRIRSNQDQSAALLFNHRVPLSKQSIDKALRRSQDGTPPPDYYIQLINALRHLNRKRYRQAVFDAATAFEIALTKILEDQISSLHTNQIRLISKKYKGKGIMALYDALKILGVAGTLTESNIRDNVTKPRNDAIHQGKDVSQIQAQTAINFVKEFIYLRMCL